MEREPAVISQQFSESLEKYKSIVDSLGPEPTYKEVETAYALEKKLDGLTIEVGWGDVPVGERKLIAKVKKNFKNIIEQEDATADYHSRKAMGAIPSILYMDEKSLNCLAGTERESAIEDYSKELIAILGRSQNFIKHAAEDVLTTERYRDWLTIEKVYKTAIKDMVIKSRSMKKDLSEKDSNFCALFETMVKNYENAGKIEEKLKFLKGFEISVE